MAATNNTRTIIKRNQPAAAAPKRKAAAPAPTPTRRASPASKKPTAKQAAPKKEAPKRPAISAAQAAVEWNDPKVKPRKTLMAQVLTSSGVMYRIVDASGKQHRGASTPKQAEINAYNKEGHPVYAASKLPWRGPARKAAK